MSKDINVGLGGGVAPFDPDAEDLTRFEPLLPDAKYVEYPARGMRRRRRSQRTSREQTIRETTDAKEFKDVVQEALDRVQGAFDGGDYDRAHGLYRDLVSEIKQNSQFRMRGGKGWKFKNPFTGNMNDVNSMRQTKSLNNIANKIQRLKAEAKREDDLRQEGAMKFKAEQDEERNQPPPSFEDAVGDREDNVAIDIPESDEEEDNSMQMRAARREFISRLEAKLRDRGVQDFGGTLGVNEVTPDYVIEKYMVVDDKDRFLDRIAEIHSLGSDTKDAEPETKRGLAEQIAESSIGKRANKLTKKIKKGVKKAGKAAAAAAVAAGVAVTNEMTRQEQEQRQQQQQQPEQQQQDPEIQRLRQELDRLRQRQQQQQRRQQQQQGQRQQQQQPENPEDRAQKLIADIDKKFGPRADIEQAEESRAQLADALERIDERNDDDPAYRGDMWLRPEFRNIIYDIAKLKVMEQPTFEKREDKTLTDLVYVPEVDAEVAGEFRDIDKDDIVMRLNVMQKQIRYMNTMLSHYDYTPTGTKLQMQYPYQPPIKRVNPKNGLKHPPLYEQQIMNASELLDRQPRPPWVKPSTMDKTILDEPDSMSNWISVDEMSIIDRVASLPNPRNLPLPMLARQYRNLRP